MTLDVRRGMWDVGCAVACEGHRWSHPTSDIPHPTSRLRRAYTLIELLVVIVCLGIASALVIPSIGSTDVLRVQSAVRTIVADIAYAQSDALARQRGRAIIFSPATNSYSVVEVRSATLDPAHDTISTVVLNNERKFHDTRLVSASFDGTTTLVFDELGGPVSAPMSTTPGNGGTITVSGSGSVFAIGVEAYTGRVTVTKISGPP